MARRPKDEWFWQIGGELHRLSDEVHHGHMRTGSGRRQWRPNVDLCEAHDGFEITAELAGVDPDSITVHFNPRRHAIVLRGKREPLQREHETSRCYQLELLYGDFEREIVLPAANIDKDGIEATFSSGLLLIQVPKKESPAKRRSIPVTEL